MKKQNKVFIAGLFLVSFFFASPSLIKAAPPLESEEVVKEEKKEKDETKKEKTEEGKKEEKEAEEFKKTLGTMRKKVEAGEKKISIRANVFRSDLQITDCTGADKARSRLNDIGDEGGLVIKGQLSIDAKNEANIEKNEGSIVNETSVNITNEYYKRC